MKSALLYTILMPLVYALLIWGGYQLSQNPQYQWEEEAAPWLGEAPPGLTLRKVQIPDEAPYNVYILPATDEMIERFRKAFPAGDKGTTYIAEFPEWSRGGLNGLRPFLTPSIRKTRRGTLEIIISNPGDIGDTTSAPVITPPYTEYLSRHPQLELVCGLLLGIGSYLFPSLFCCIGYLWIQRRRVLGFYTAYICLVLPLVSCGILYMAEILIFGGYDGIMSMFGAAIYGMSNAICSSALIGITAVIRLLWRSLTSAPSPSS